MMVAIASRAPSLIIFGTIQTAMWSWVYSQWRKPSMINGPLPSAIPKGYIGKGRFQHAHGAYAYA